MQWYLLVYQERDREDRSTYPSGRSFYKVRGAQKPRIHVPSMWTNSRAARCSKPQVLGRNCGMHWRGSLAAKPTPRKLPPASASFYSLHFLHELRSRHSRTGKHRLEPRTCVPQRRRRQASQYQSPRRSARSSTAKGPSVLGGPHPLILSSTKSWASLSPLNMAAWKGVCYQQMLVACLSWCALRLGQP